VVDTHAVNIIQQTRLNKLVEVNIIVPRADTIIPKLPAATASAARAPNMIPMIRSIGLGGPPRCGCPSTTARASYGVSTIPSAGGTTITVDPTGAGSVADAAGLLKIAF